MVNNAGIFTGLHTIVDETEDEWDRTMAVNAKSVWLGCKFAIRQMLTQEPVDGSRGRIVNIASIGGLVGLAAEPAYCAAKGAVVNLTRQLAVDFAPERINVNAVCPGFLATAMVRPFLDDPELNQVLHAKSPWPELGTARTWPRRPSSWPPTTPAGPPAPCSPSTAASPPPDHRKGERMDRLQDKVVVVTGASSGFGRGHRQGVRRARARRSWSATCTRTPTRAASRRTRR